MSVTWDEYLTKPDAPQAYTACHRRCRAFFVDQRNNIRHVIDATAPRSVACLGAGVLSDIPYRRLIERGSDVHLVDWLPGVCQSGIKSSIIEIGDDGSPQCVYCDERIGCPEDYCVHYAKRTADGTGVCENYVAAGDDDPACAAFAHGDCPTIHHEDVTGGYASHFSRRLLPELRGVGSWEQAFARAGRLCQKMNKHRAQISVADDSVELVTSSMVVSQFDHEPYTYFSHRAADFLGQPSPREQRGLAPAMERLRSQLLTAQVQRHCQEIVRMLAPGGVCYMSFELFHVAPRGVQWFLVQGAAKVLEVISRHFLFRGDIIGEDQAEGEPSLVCSLVLEPKSDPPTSPPAM